MKKTTILLGMLSLGFAYAQQVPVGKVGVNTDIPTETLDVKGTVRVQELPTAGVGKIYSGNPTKTGVFAPTKTVVADSNGALGIVDHIVEPGTAAKTTLQWNDGTKKWEAVEPATVAGPGQNDEAWKKQQTADRVTNADDNVGIYRSTNVGIGDFSGSSVNAPLHIRKTNAASNIVFGNIQITDKTRDDIGIASMFQFLDRNGGRYAMIGDVYQDNNIFEFRGEHGFTTRLSSFNTDSGTNHRASIDLKGGGFGNATGNGDIVKIKFNTGQFKNNPGAYGITSISKHGNWYFGSDFGNENTPADQKVVIRGALRFDGPAFPGLTDNASVSNVLAGTMFYSNGHFFGVIPNGTNAFKWKQLDNVDYTGTNGISVANNTISLPAGANGQVLAWNGNAWAPAAPVDNDTKSPWALLDGNPASSVNNTPSTDINFKGRVGIGQGVQPTESIDVTGSARLRGVSAITGAEVNKLLVINSNGVVKSLVGTTNGQVLTWNRGAWEVKAVPTSQDTNTNIYTDNGTIPTDRTVTLNAKIDWNGGNGFNISRNGETLSLKAQENNKANFIGFYRNGGDTRTGYFGFDSDRHNNITLTNQIADGKIVLNNQTEIKSIPENTGATHVLVEGANGLVSKKAISSLTTSAAATEPWFIAGGTTQATNTNNTDTGKIYFKGAVGIGDFSGNANLDQLGTLSTTQKQATKLIVKGAVVAGSFKGAHGATIFPDYVFQKYYTGASSIKADYTFKSLSQVEDFVKSNGHLPGYKSAADIKAQGYIDVMETQISNVEKIEELYLHTIEQEKALKEKDAKIKSLEERLERLEKLIK